LVNVHTDIETLKKDGSGVESEIEDRGNVPAGTLSRLNQRTGLMDWISPRKPPFPNGMGIEWIMGWQ
jgi:hypothetical protein